MALSTETDPTQAVNDLLDGTDAGDWSNAGAKPSDIERVEETERRVKEHRSGDAIYLFATLESDLAKIDPAGAEMDEVAVVTAQAWTTTSAAQAEALVRDLINIIAGKANDSNDTTAFVDWWPQTVEDFTGQKVARSGDHYVKAVQAQLRDLRST